MSEKNTICSGANCLILPCSGGSDVGKLADVTARTLAEEGVGKVYCLAGLGAQIKPMVETVLKAEHVLVLDGCSVACGKKIMEMNGITDFIYQDLSHSGFEKGKTPLSDDVLKRSVSLTKAALH